MCGLIRSQECCGLRAPEISQDLWGSLRQGPCLSECAEDETEAKEFAVSCGLRNVGWRLRKSHELWDTIHTLRRLP